MQRRTKRRLNKVELAVQLLGNQYQQRLATSDFLEAVEVLKIVLKASVFITLLCGEIRDL